MELRKLETGNGPPTTLLLRLLVYVISTTSEASSRASKSSTVIGSSIVSVCMLAMIEDLSQTFPELPNSTKSLASSAEVASAQFTDLSLCSEVSNWKKYAVSLSDNFIDRTRIHGKGYGVVTRTKRNLKTLSEEFLNLLFKPFPAGKRARRRHGPASEHVNALEIFGHLKKR